MSKKYIFAQTIFTHFLGQYHTDYVRELIDKSMAYDNYARQALVTTYEGAGLHPQQVFDFVWGRHLADTEYEDRPLSKLTEDVLDLLNIRKSKVK